MNLLRNLLAAVFALTSFAASAADYPAPKEGDWIAKDFKFHTGETMASLRLHYTTIGEPTGQPVLMLHGTGESRHSHADAGVCRRTVRPRPAARRHQILHHPS